MGQADRPAPFDQLLSQIRRSTAGLDGRRLHRAEPLDRVQNGLGIVEQRPIRQDPSGFVEHTHLHQFLMIVQTHKNLYTTHGSLLLEFEDCSQPFLNLRTTSFHPYLGSICRQSRRIPI